MVIHRKSCPFENEYVSAFDFDPRTVRCLESAEGKCRPEQLGVSEFEEMGKTVGKMTRITRSA